MAITLTNHPGGVMTLPPLLDIFSADAMNNIPLIYEIKVEGLIDSRWADWFGGLAISYANNQETILTGEITDQTALHGVLERIRDLGLNLISVKRIDEEP